MKSILLSFILFCAFTGSVLAVQSIRQPFPELKLTDGRVLVNARLKAFNSDSVFVRDDDGFVQVPYKLFPEELQPQLAKARAAANPPPNTSPDRGSAPPSGPAAARPALAKKPPFQYQTLGVSNGYFIELLCFYDHIHELFGPETWVRLLQWGAKEDGGAVVNHAIVVFELKEQLWAWDLNRGFIPLDLPPESKEDIAQVAASISAKFPDIVAGSPYYRYDNAPQQPEPNLPQVMTTSDVPALRDATLVGAQLGARRPVNVVQFSVGGTQSAAAVFIFSGQLCIYCPDSGGTHRFISQFRGIADTRLLYQAFRLIHLNVSALKSLNYSVPVSADGQN